MWRYSSKRMACIMHPKNKQARKRIGITKGIKRTKGIKNSLDPHADKRHRDTTKLCSCYMCGNPRHKSKERLTIQERKNITEIE